MTSSLSELVVVHITTVHSVQDTRILHHQCTALAEAGYSTHLLATAAAPFEHHGVKVLPLRSYRGRLQRMVLGPLDVLRRTHRLRPTVVQIHDPELLPIALVLRLFGYRVVYDAHEDHAAAMYYRDYLGPLARGIAARLVKIVERVIIPRLTAVIAPTPTIVGLMRRYHTTVALVQNYPAVSEFPITETERPQGSSKEEAVVYVGVISPERGIMQMLQAVAEVARRQPCRLLLAGDFSDASLLQHVRSLPEWRHVEYLGRIGRAEVATLFSRARAGLVILEPNRNYSFSVATKMFEYMAAGLPVIASDFPSWKPIFEESRCGVQVDPFDSHALADAIAHVLNNPEEAEAQGRRGRDAVRSRYNWETQQKTLLTLYEHLIGPPPQRNATPGNPERLSTGGR